MSGEAHVFPWVPRVGDTVWLHGRVPTQRMVMGRRARRAGGLGLEVSSLDSDIALVGLGSVHPNEHAAMVAWVELCREALGRAMARPAPDALAASAHNAVLDRAVFAEHRLFRYLHETPTPLPVWAVPSHEARPETEP